MLKAANARRDPRAEADLATTMPRPTPQRHCDELRAAAKTSPAPDRLLEQAAALEVVADSLDEGIYAPATSKQLLYDARAVSQSRPTRTTAPLTATHRAQCARRPRQTTRGGSMTDERVGAASGEARGMRGTTDGQWWAVGWARRGEPADDPALGRRHGRSQSGLPRRRVRAPRPASVASSLRRPCCRRGRWAARRSKACASAAVRRRT